MVFVDYCIVDTGKQDLSAQFLRMQKIQFIDLQEPFECYEED